MLVHLFDANVDDRRGRESQLRSVGVDKSWQVRATSSRNDLLTALDADVTAAPTRRQSIALIDSRAEPGDLEQLGFRIVETIRRHAYLWKATRLLIWVDRLSFANRQYAEEVEADVVIDDEYVDREDGRPLVELLEQASQRSPCAHGRRTTEIDVCCAAEPDPGAEEAVRDAHFLRWFGFEPDGLDYMLLWGIADAVELKFLYRYCAEEGSAPSALAARKACERLTEAMRLDRDLPDSAPPTNTEIARRFLTEALPAGPSPLSKLSWPALVGTRELLVNEEVRRLAFLEPGADRELELFLSSIDPNFQLRTVKTAARYEMVNDAVRAAAESLKSPLNDVYDRLQRSAHALDDAYEDLRRHGSPSTDDS